MTKKYNSILKCAKLKVTSARILILDLMTNSKTPLTVEMIREKIKNKKVDQVTVYRTIESLLKAKIIGRVDLRKGSVFYELLGDHHHHIVCTKCGVLEDFESCRVEDITQKILLGSKKFRIISDHSFELFGICKLCDGRI